VFGTGSSGGGYYYPPISCQPEIIIFNISLNKGELYTYKEKKNECGEDNIIQLQLTLLRNIILLMNVIQ